MTSVEEVMAKVNVDSSGVDADMDNFKRKVGRALEHTEKTFLHAGSAARAFHRQIENLNDVIPGLGSALQFAMNPIVGVLAAATVGFTYFKDKLKEVNEELDKLQTLSRDPFTGVKDSAREAADAIAEIHRQNRKFAESMDDTGRRMVKNLNDETEKLKSQQKVRNEILENQKQVAMVGKDPAQRLRIEQEFAEKKAKSEITSAQEQVKLQERWRWAAGLNLDTAKKKLGEVTQESESPENRNRIRGISERKAFIGDLEKRQEALKGLIDHWSGLSTESESSVFGRQNQKWAKILGLNTNETTLEDLRRQEQANRTRIEKEKTELQPMTQAEKDLTEALQEAQEKMRKSKDTFDQLDEAWKAGKRTLDELKNTPLKSQAGSAKELEASQATIEQLAHGMFWSHGWNNGLQVFAGGWQRSPYARTAQEILKLRSEAFNANALGNLSLRDQDNARISELKKQLGGTGVLKSEDYLETIMDDIAKLRSQSESGGIPVQPANGA